MTAPSETLEVYKLTVEMADRVSARRGRANEFYLAVETLLLGVPASAQLFVGADATTHSTVLLLGVCGLVISTSWWLQLRSYRDLNAAKFKTINKIESDHLAVRPFTDEWSELKRDPVATWRNRYAELGTVERVMPVLFALLHVGIVVVSYV